MSVYPAFGSYLDALNPLVAQADREGVIATPDSARAALAGLNAFAHAPARVAEILDRHAAGVPVRVSVPRPGEVSDVIGTLPHDRHQQRRGISL